MADRDSFKDHASFPALARLELSNEDYAGLARQGFVSKEQRGAGRPIYKLRFRRGSEQIVRYLGVGLVFVSQVQTELGALQQGQQLDRLLAQRTRAAGVMLRESKATTGARAGGSGLSLSRI